MAVGLLNIQAAEKDADEGVKKELTALKGDWKIASRAENGNETPLETIKDRVITFEDGKYVLRDGNEIIAEATFKINPSKDPKWFDLTFKGKTQLGIYKIEGDTVRFCIAAVDAERPTDFTSKEGSGRVLTAYKKQKK
jgi:uncharacterized protein (TIGR03067 family)